MAAFKKQSGRQELIVAEADFDYTQLPTDGSMLVLIELPVKATLVGGELVVYTAFAGGTGLTASIGDNGQAARYLIGTTSLAATARVPLVPTGAPIIVTVPPAAALDMRKIGITKAAGTGQTAGRARLVVTYYVHGRATFTQGEDK